MPHSWRRHCGNTWRNSVFLWTSQATIPRGGHSVPQIFGTSLPTFKPLDLEQRNSARLRMWRSSVFPGGQPRPHPKGTGPSVPNFWDLPPARVRSPAMWATNQPGDSQLGDTFLVNWATDVETTGPQLWKCERLTIAVLEQLCAVLIGQRPFSITHRINLPHSSLECYEVAGLIDASQCSVNQTAQVVSQPISDFLPTILVDTLVTILCRRPLITACYGEIVLEYGRGRSFT